MHCIFVFANMFNGFTQTQWRVNAYLRMNKKKQKKTK